MQIKESGNTINKKAGLSTAITDKNNFYYDHSQLRELKDSLFAKENNIILIARLTPILSKDIKVCAKLVNDLYLIAVRSNYSVFRLGGERIIIVPAEERIMGLRTGSTTATITPSNI